MKLENKQIGIAVGLLLAVMMLFLPNVDAAKYKFNPETVSKWIENKEDHVTPIELSQWIIAGKADYQLIDIRSSKVFQKGHIKGAINIPLKKLLKKTTIDNEVSDSKMIVLYSNGNSHAHQAALILKTIGKDTYVLEGGFNGWIATVLNPKTPKTFTDDEILKYKASQSIANYFGGGSGNQVADQPKAKTKKVIRKKRKKKKLEGC